MRNVFLWIIVFLLIILLIFLLWWFFIRNQAPVAIDNALTTAAETAVTANIIDDDSDPDGDPLSLDTTAVMMPSNGTVQLDQSGTAVYTPNPGFSGVDQFRYRVCDPRDNCDQANVTITVTPVAVNDAFTGSKNTAVTGNVLVNDRGTALSATPQSTGELVLQSNGDFTFTPATDFMGTHTFSYETCDSTPSCVMGQVTIDIIDMELVADSYTTRKNTAVSGNLHDNDSDNALPVSPTPVNGPANGTVTIEPTGVFTYTPNTDFVGSDVFSYQVCPSSCLSAPVTINVTDGVVAVDDTFITYVNNEVSGNVLENDIGDGLSVNLNVSPSNGPTNGTAEMQTDGTAKYQPNLGYSGTDKFTYEVCDSGGNCDQAEVTIEIAPPPDPLLHTVVQGEWLIQIARCYGTTVHAIRQHNYIPYPDLIYPRQVLTITGIGSVGPFQGPPCVQSHTVAAGETLASIAQAYGITESELARVNGLYTYYYYGYGYYGHYHYHYYYKTLYVGQKLFVPRPIPDYMQPKP